MSFRSCTDAYGEAVLVLAGTAQLQTDGTAADKTHSPGLGLPPGYALFGPLGVRGQVVDQLAADLVGGLDGVVLLQTHTSDG